MDEHIYALEKLVEAVHELVTNAGRVQERIFEAGLHLDRIQPSDVPEGGLRNLLEPISKLSEEDNEAGELDKAEEVLSVEFQRTSMRRCHCIQAKKRSTSQRRI